MIVERKFIRPFIALLVGIASCPAIANPATVPLTSESKALTAEAALDY
jgi:hypothetical protein